MRFEYLYDTVDYFLISESESTQRGELRQLPTEQTRHLLKPFWDKIVRVAVNFSGFEQTSWRREVHQRDTIAYTALERFGDTPFILVVADADEVPDRANYERLRGMYDELSTRRAHFHTQLFYYNFNWRAVDTLNHQRLLIWQHTYALSDKLLRAIDRKHSFTAAMRYSLPGSGPAAATPLIGGWHCSACMSPERISEKSRSFAHTEFPVASVEWARHCIEHGVDLFNRTEVTFARNDATTRSKYALDAPSTTFPYCDTCKTLSDWISLVPREDH